MKKQLPASALKGVIRYQQEVLVNWSLLLNVLGDVEKWSAFQKKMLVNLIKLKQTRKERDYLLQLQKHNRLWHSLKKAGNIKGKWAFVQGLLI